MKRQLKNCTKLVEQDLNIEYKIHNAHICNDGVCFKTTFILVTNITSRIILGNPFLALLYHFIKTEE
jgi:hypothetical protein